MNHTGTFRISINDIKEYAKSPKNEYLTHIKDLDRVVLDIPKDMSTLNINGILLKAIYKHYKDLNFTQFSEGCDHEWTDTAGLFTNWTNCAKCGKAK